MHADDLETLTASIAWKHYGQRPACECLNQRRTVFRLHLRDRRAVVKLARLPGTAGAEAIAKELSVLEFLSTTDVPVPRVEFADAQGAAFGRAYLLMESAGDVTVENHRSRPTSVAALYQDMGWALAAIHDVTLRSLVGLDRSSSGSASAETFWAASCQSAKLFAQGGVLPAHAVEQLRIAAPPTFSGRQLCHSDFNAAQCVVSDGQLRAVVDWEAAWVGNAVVDFEIARGYLDLVGDPVRIAAFEGGYASRLPLPTRDDVAVRMVFLANLMKAIRSQGDAAWEHAVRSGRISRARELFTGYAVRLPD